MLFNVLGCHSNELNYWIIHEYIHMNMKKIDFFVSLNLNCYLYIMYLNETKWTQCEYREYIYENLVHVLNRFFPLSRTLLFVLDPYANEQWHTTATTNDIAESDLLTETVGYLGNHLITVSVNRALHLWSSSFTDCGWHVAIQFIQSVYVSVSWINFMEFPLKHYHRVNKEAQILLNEFFEQSTDGWAWWS